MQRDDQEIELLARRRGQPQVRRGQPGDLVIVRGQCRAQVRDIGVGIVDHQQPAARGVLVGQQRPRRDQAEARRGLLTHQVDVHQQLEADQGPDAREQRQVAHRLREEIIRAGLQTAHAIGDVAQCGHHDDRDVRGLGIGLQELADLEAVEARHHDVEQDEIGRLAPRQVDRLVAVIRRDDVVVLAGQLGF